MHDEGGIMQDNWTLHRGKVSWNINRDYGVSRFLDGAALSLIIDRTNANSVTLQSRVNVRSCKSVSRKVQQSIIKDTSFKIVDYLKQRARGMRGGKLSGVFTRNEKSPIVKHINTSIKERINYSRCISTRYSRRLRVSRRVKSVNNSYRLSIIFSG